MVAGEHLILLNDGDVVDGQGEGILEAALLDGGSLAQGPVGTFNVLHASTEEGLLANWGLDDVRVDGSGGSDGQLEGGGHVDLLLIATKVVNTELLGNGKTWTDNTEQFKAIGTVADDLVLTVQNHRQGLHLDVASTVGDGYVVTEGVIIVQNSLSNGETAVDSVDLGVGDGETKSPAIKRIHPTKEAHSVERILIDTERAADDTGEDGGLEGEIGHELDGSIGWDGIDGVGQVEGGCQGGGEDGVPGEVDMPEDLRPLTRTGTNNNPAGGQRVVVQEDGLGSNGQIIGLNSLLLMAKDHGGQQGSRGQDSLQLGHHRDRIRPGKCQKSYRHTPHIYLATTGKWDVDHVKGLPYLQKTLLF